MKRCKQKGFGGGQCMLGVGGVRCVGGGEGGRQDGSGSSCGAGSEGLLCGLESRAHLVPRAKPWGCCAEGRGGGLLPLL